MAIPTGASAQDVTLKTLDGNIDLVGEIVSFDGEVFRLRTNVGVLAIGADEVTCTGEGCPEELVTTRWVPGVVGGEMNVSVENGELVLTGTFESVTEDGEMQMNTAFGPLSLPMARAVCEGPGCPILERSVTYSAIPQN